MYSWHRVETRPYRAETPPTLTRPTARRNSGVRRAVFDARGGGPLLSHRPPEMPLAERDHLREHSTYRADEALGIRTSRRRPSKKPRPTEWILPHSPSFDHGIGV